MLTEKTHEEASEPGEQIRGVDRTLQEFRAATGPSSTGPSSTAKTAASPHFNFSTDSNKSN
jgi:hypothetical protein